MQSTVSKTIYIRRYFTESHKAPYKRQPLHHFRFRHAWLLFLCRAYITLCFPMTSRIA